MRQLFLFAACITISGCETIGNWADDAGSYMPVLSDERCEHWQCFTEGGRQQSEMNKRMREQRLQTEQQQEQGQPQDPATMQQQPLSPPPGDINTNPYDYYRP
jgi:hypothetical protein